MKDLTIKKKEKEKYIVEVIDCGDSLAIKFADGTVFSDYEKTDENIEILKDAMEAQKDSVLGNLPKFRRREIMYDVGAVAIPAASTYLMLTQATDITNPEQLAIATGAVVGVELVGLLSQSIKNRKKVKEIKKFMLRDEMQEDLDNLDQYPHALAGVKSSIVRLAENYEDPFNALFSDMYTTKDLEKISKNIEREKTYQLTPIKK